jgi:hypothetical protein
MSDFVYFIESGEFVKIGFASFPAGRLGQLQKASPHPMRVIAAFPGTISDEKTVQRSLVHSRHRSEWYRKTADVECAIENARSASRWSNVVLSDLPEIEWLTGLSRHELCPVLFRETGGEVTANDFLRMEAAE